MRLVNPSDAELNAAFAEKVAGWMVKSSDNSGVFGYDPKDDIRGHHQTHLVNFTASADAVLPWLENWTANDCLDGTVSVNLIVGELGREVSSNAKTFPKAAVLALLRAHGVEVEFTQ